VRTEFLLLRNKIHLIGHGLDVYHDHLLLVAGGRDDREVLDVGLHLGPEVVVLGGRSRGVELVELPVNRQMIDFISGKTESTSCLNLRAHDRILLDLGKKQAYKDVKST